MKQHLFYQFAEEATETKPAPPPPKADAPDYHFEGFTVVINEKIALTPIQRVKKKKHG